MASIPDNEVYRSSPASSHLPRLTVFLCIAGTLECEAAKEEAGCNSGRCVLVKDLQQDSFSCPFANIQKIRLLPSGKEGVSRQSQFAPDTTDGRLYNTLKPEWNPWLKKEKGIDH